MANEIEIRVKSKDMTGPGTASAKKNLQGIGDSAQRIGDVAQGVLASQVFDRMGQAAMRGLQSTFTAAKDLGESVNAVNVSFGSSSKQILDWGKNNAASFGLSQRAFNQAVVPMGAILKNTGIDMGTVSDKTISLTERAADMASVFNVDVSEALDAIQAGLRGEADPLERFGVGLSAAAVEAKALADTGKQSADALTEQEKMLARVALIMEQTSQVQGDFANTSDDAANAQRIATAEMENAQAVIGQAFLPVMAMLATAVANVARWFQDLPGPIQAVVAIVGTLGAAFVILAPKIVATKAALQGFALTSSPLGGKLRGVGAVAGKVALGFGALLAASAALKAAFADELNPQIDAMAVGLEKWAKGSKVSGEAARILGGDLDGLKDSLTVLADGGLSKTTHELTKAVSHITPFGSELGDAEEKVGALDAALAGMVSSGNAEGAAATFGRLAEVARDQGISVDGLRELLPQYAGALEVAGDAAKDSGDKQGDFADKTGDAKQELEEATSALDEYIAKQRAAVDPVLGLMDALDQVEEAQSAYNEALRDNGRESPEARNAARELAGAILGAEVAASDADLSFDAFESKLRQWVRQGKISKGEADVLRDAIKGARGQAEKFSGSYVAKLKGQIDQSSLNRAESALARLTRERDVWINTRTRIGAPPAGGRPMATGGIVGAHAAEGGPRGGSDVMVGEQGMERVELPFGTRVVPAGQTRAELGAGGTQRVVLELRSSGSRMDDLLLEILRDAINVRGGDVQVVLGR